MIESVKDYRVLFVGDDIIDEYHYVKPLGKSAKEHVIPMLFLGSEVFDGGTQAAANHLTTFCAKVDVCKSPTAVRKVRFVDRDHMRKLAEVHYDPMTSRNGYFDGDFDAVAVTDFGHNRISGEMIGRLCKLPFLAVAVQTNASNIGFNLITKYPRADYVVIDEPEARLAAHDREGHIEDVMHKLAHGRCERFVVTHGKFGAYGYDNGRFMHCPALSGDGLPIDTMGAGDAFFSVTAPMAKTGSMEDLLFIGNAAGALKTRIVGHRQPITKQSLVEFIKSHAA